MMIKGCWYLFDYPVWELSLWRPSHPLPQDFVQKYGGLACPSELATDTHALPDVLYVPR